ncbi:MAG: AI-2E family transporter, partial [Planctomycetota bacterium]
METLGTDGAARAKRSDLGPGGRALRIGAFLAIVVAGLKLAADLLVPIVLAAFFTIVCLPIVRMLRRTGMPNGLALGLVLVLALALIGGITLLVVDQATEFAAERGKYEARLATIVKDTEAWLARRGIEIAPHPARDPLDPKQLFNFLGQAAGTAASVFSSMALVVLLLVFMLGEVSTLSEKIARNAGDREVDFTRFHDIVAQVYSYLGIKTVLSLVTGLLFGVFLALLGVDFYVLWGFLAFILNYIPNIGSLLAAIPPIFV